MANNARTLGFGNSEFATSASDPHAISVSHRTNSLRRSSASATAPPQSAAAASGTSCAAPMSPTMADDLVSSYTWTGNAT